MPQWVQRQYLKYHKEYSSSSSEDDDDTDNHVHNGVTNENGEKDSCNESDTDDLEGDPTARRCQNPFYQNIEDQGHFRHMADFDEENDAMSNIFNISNPRGEDFMRWCKDQVLPTYKEIMACFNSLKNRKAVSPNLTDFSLPTNKDY